MYSVQILLIVYVFSLHASSASWIDIFQSENPAVNDKPLFCKDYQCPNFTVVDTKPEYEVRRYEPTTWVYTAETPGWFSYPKMYVRLVKYMMLGYNELGVRMPMTVPVLTKVSTEAPTEMYFMLPEDKQTNPPAPTDDSLKIMKMPTMTVYVRSFPGFAWESEYTSELEALKTALGSETHYKPDVMYKVVYDGPLTFMNRHNEIWLEGM